MIHVKVDVLVLGEELDSVRMIAPSVYDVGDSQLSKLIEENSQARASPVRSLARRQPV